MKRGIWKGWWWNKRWDIEHDKKNHWCYARSWKAGVQITTTEIAPDFEKGVTCRMVYEVSQHVEEHWRTVDK